MLLTQQDSRVGSGLFLNPEQSARLSLSQENLLDSKVNASILSHPGFQESPIQGSSIGGAQQQSFQQDTPTKKVYRAPYAVSDASMTSSLVNNFKTQSEDAKVCSPVLYSYWEIFKRLNRISQDAVVRFVNQQLMTQGFPPLHPTLYSRVSSRGDSTFALSSGQLMSLKMTIMGILEEYVRKNEVNQSLIRRVSEAEFSGSQTGRLSREAVQNVLNPDLQVRWQCNWNWITRLIIFLSE